MLAYLIVLVQIVSVVVSPALFILIYAMFASDRDGYAFLSYFQSMSGSYKLITRGVFIGGISFFLFYPNFLLKKRNTFEIIVTVSALLLILSIVSSLILKEENVLNILSHIVYSGIPVFLVWLTYCSGNKYRKYFIWYVFFMTFISFVVILFPEQMYFLDGAYYKRLENVFVHEYSGLNFKLSGGFDKTMVNKYGVFHNPNAYGFYAIILLVCAIYVYFQFNFLKNNKKMSLNKGLVITLFVLIGLLSWLNSLSRGPLLFLFFGFTLFFLILFFTNKKIKLSLIQILFVSIVFVFTSVFFVYGIASGYLLPSFDNPSFVYRIEGYIRAIEVVKNYPLLGHPNAALELEGAYPHFLPLAFFVEYGLFAASIISFILFAISFYVIFMVRKRLREATYNKGRFMTPLLLLFVVIGIAITNNLAAPILFWLCLAESIILLKNRESDFVYKN